MMLIALAALMSGAAPADAPAWLAPHVPAAAAVAAAADAWRVPAADQPTRLTDLDMGAVPFGDGERSTYQVKLGAMSVGSGSLEILGIEKVGGFDTYRARLRIQGGVPLAKVNDTFETWMDVDGLFTRRFFQDQHEVSFKRKRTYDFDPERGTWRRHDGLNGALHTKRPLDDVSFLYFVRTLPLEVGKTYSVPDYFKEHGNPVVIRVLRRETVKVPAGTFKTIVVQPIIKTDGLFGEGGKAEVYFSDDERRMMVQLKSKVPVVGSLSLHLREYEPGS